MLVFFWCNRIVYNTHTKEIQMLKPRNLDSHKALLTPELLAECLELSKLAPTFGQVAPEGYEERAKAFNARARELGATLMMVVEK
jgi:hypothetical protein